MINNKKIEKAQNELDLDIQAKFQTQSIYNTQQTLKQGSIRNDFKKTPNMDSNIKGISEESKEEYYNYEHKINSQINQDTALREVDQNRQILPPLLQQQDKQHKFSNEELNIHKKENQQPQRGQINDGERRYDLENSQKDENNQQLFSQEILDNEQLLSMNKPLSPINKSINIQFQQYFNHEDIYQFNDQNDLHNNNNNNKNNNQQYGNQQNEEIASHRNGDILSHRNEEIVSHRNGDILSQRNGGDLLIKRDEVSQEEQKMLEIKGVNSMNGLRANSAILSKKGTQVQQVEENKSTTSTQRQRLKNYENQYFDLITTQYNMCISTIVIFANTFTFGIFWGLFFYEFRSASHLKDIKEGNYFLFIISSMSSLDYEDFFIYYRLIADTVLFVLVLIIVFGIPKQYLEISKLFFFYANFVLTVFCFARMEKLLYFDDVLQLKAALKKYNKYEADNVESFKSSFENYYLILKLYIYSIVVSIIIQMICFVYYQPKQNSTNPYLLSENNINNHNNNHQNNSYSNVNKQTNILPNMLNSTVQINNGTIELNVHPIWKQEVPSHLNQIVE